MEQENPLVSIIVITYNSSKYVLETLESAKAQTYRNIELIVSDDCSLDDTVDVCRNWIEENKDRFVHTELITVEKNTGTSANCNRGVKKTTGEWVKIIAGDDTLFPDAMERVLDYVNQNPHVKVLETSSICYQDNFTLQNIMWKHVPQFWFFCEAMTAERQFKELLIRSLLHGPTLFYKKELFSNVGLFDENIKLVEDRPFWIKLTRCGYKIYYTDIETVKYRVYSTSVTNSKKGNKLFNDFYKIRYEMSQKVIFKDAGMFTRFAIRWYYFVRLSFDNLGLNRNRLINRFLFYLFDRISPLNILFRLQQYRGEKLMKQ